MLPQTRSCDDGAEHDDRGRPQPAGIDGQRGVREEHGECQRYEEKTEDERDDVECVPFIHEVASCVTTIFPAPTSRLMWALPAVPLMWMGRAGPRSAKSLLRGPRTTKLPTPTR